MWQMLHLYVLTPIECVLCVHIDCVLCNFHENLCHSHILMVFRHRVKEKHNAKKIVGTSNMAKYCCIHFVSNVVNVSECAIMLSNTNTRDHRHMFEIVNIQEFYCIFFLFSSLYTYYVYYILHYHMLYGPINVIIMRLKWT